MSRVRVVKVVISEDGEEPVVILSNGDELDVKAISVDWANSETLPQAEFKVDILHGIFKHSAKT